MKNQVGLGFKVDKTIALDFDGVIHAYRNGWEGITAIRDKPVEGVREAIKILRHRGYKILVYSTRCSTPQGRQAINEWCKKWFIKVLKSFTPRVEKNFSLYPFAFKNAFILLYSIVFLNVG